MMNMTLNNFRGVAPLYIPILCRSRQIAACKRAFIVLSVSILPPILPLCVFRLRATADIQRRPGYTIWRFYLSVRRKVKNFFIELKSKQCRNTLPLVQ